MVGPSVDWRVPSVIPCLLVIIEVERVGKSITLFLVIEKI